MQWCVHTQLCLTLCNSMDCNPPGSSVHGILQAGILEWVAMPSSRGSSQLRDRTQVSHISGGLFTSEPPGKTSNVISSPKEEFIHPVAENCFELCLLCPGGPPPTCEMTGSEVRTTYVTQSRVWLKAAWNETWPPDPAYKGCAHGGSWNVETWPHHGCFCRAPWRGAPAQLSSLPSGNLRFEKLSHVLKH